MFTFPPRESDENGEYLREQLITYLGNKRKLLDFIGMGIEIAKNSLGKKKVSTFDVFSGSGIVARYLKRFSDVVYANDLEAYSRVINECYLTNKSSVDWEALTSSRDEVLDKIKKNPIHSFISENYAPDSMENIQRGERCFYTPQNALFLDSARYHLNSLPQDHQTLLLAPLLSEASIKVNTSGVFKSFYKSDGVGKFGGRGSNALSRILSPIQLNLPLLSEFECDSHVLQLDAREAAKEVGNVDIAYLDPPYNQHPYGSNYFMLNLLVDGALPDTGFSKTTGIPKNWNRSKFNKRAYIHEEFFKLVAELNAKFCIISFNNEGFISKSDFLQGLAKLGRITCLETYYKRFPDTKHKKASKNYVTEYLFLLEKK